MGTNYEQGRSFEYRAKAALERNDFTVIRSAGSRTPADLVAGKPGKVLLVQCTTSAKSKNQKDKQALLEMATNFGAKAVMVWKTRERGPLVWEFLHGNDESLDSDHPD